MDITPLLTDETILEEIGKRLLHRRLDMQLTQADLAHQAGVSKRTIERIEDGASAQLDTLIRVMRVLELVPGLEHLVPPAQPGPIELLRNQGKTRQRAGKKRKTDVREPVWAWKDET